VEFFFPVWAGEAEQEIWLSGRGASARGAGGGGGSETARAQWPTCQGYRDSSDWENAKGVAGDR